VERCTDQRVDNLAGSEDRAQQELVHVAVIK
jgi:hypothetical protein